MSTEQEKLQAKINEMSKELDNLRKQVRNHEELAIAENAERLGIDIRAPLPDDTDYEKALRIAVAESKAREMAQNNERKEWLAIAESLKEKKGGRRQNKSRKLSGHKRSGRKLSQRKQKRSRCSKH